jgi:hypothetical protein
MLAFRPNTLRFPYFNKQLYLRYMHMERVGLLCYVGCKQVLAC